MTFIFLPLFFQEVGLGLAEAVADHPLETLNFFYAGLIIGVLRQFGDDACDGISRPEKVEVLNTGFQSFNFGKPDAFGAASAKHLSAHCYHNSPPVFEIGYCKLLVMSVPRFSPSISRVDAIFSQISSSRCSTSSRVIPEEVTAENWEYLCLLRDHVVKYPPPQVIFVLPILKCGTYYLITFCPHCQARRFSLLLAFVGSIIYEKENNEKNLNIREKREAI